MITCTNCGKLTNEGIENCQYCGALLPGKIGSGVDAKMGAPELPSWLEALRAGEQPGTPAATQLNYPTAESIDKDALPSWMRSESAEYISADQSSPQWPASMPAPNTGSGLASPRAISANSLIDEQSLPSWIRDSQSTSLSSAQRDIQASSLVQPDALPEWMRNAQQQPVVQPPIADFPASAPSQGITGNGLIDAQAVPAWISEHNQGGAGEVTLAAGQSGFAARSLVDMNSLPNWLRENEQEQRSVRTETSSPVQSGQTTIASGNLAAPSLIDMNALPEWLRAGAEQGSVEKAVSPSPAHSFVPPRVDNVRVPSRPRGEIGPREQSEVAANVFASMLGVSSPTPYLPSQSPQNMPGVQPPQGQAQPQHMGSVPPGPQPGGAGPTPMTGYSSTPGSYPMGHPGNQQPGMPQYSPANLAAMPLHSQMGSNVKPVKRGFLETIRSWFSR